MFVKDMHIASNQSTGWMKGKGWGFEVCVSLCVCVCVCERERRGGKEYGEWEGKERRERGGKESLTRKSCSQGCLFLVAMTISQHGGGLYQ